MLSKEDYQTITVKGKYLVKYEFQGKIKTKVMDGDELLEIENGGYTVIKYYQINKLAKEDFYLIKVNKEMDYSEMSDFSNFLEENGIKHLIIKDGVELKNIPENEKPKFLNWIKKELGLNNDSEG